MPIIPVSGITSGITPTALSGATGTAKAAGSDSFSSALASGINNLQDVQSKADGLTAQAATGQLTDVHDLMIASTEASLATELTVAVRNRAVESFNEIMRMQV